MIQLDVLSGKKAGTSIVTRHFPFYVGRSPDSLLRLDDSGVWERHLMFSRRGQEIVFDVEPNALVTLNHEPVKGTAPLRNGDVVEVGAAKLRFALSAARQRSQAWREVVTWIGLGFLCIAQVGVIYWVLD
ncbi:MAG: FHA domain-containing protein [Verrucomicrobia subdivision 3 bacterium]|nr:FHA domain-containing protein [Limisphaerales bacterium]